VPAYRHRRPHRFHTVRFGPRHFNRRYVLQEKHPHQSRAAIAPTVSNDLVRHGDPPCGRERPFMLRFVPQPRLNPMGFHHEFSAPGWHVTEAPTISPDLAKTHRVHLESDQLKPDATG
jgi:hypothetical protein